MAQALAKEMVPLEFLVLMIANDYPDLIDDLDAIIQKPDISRHDAEKEIARALDMYQMQLVAGRIKPKALQS
ncbi:MAG: hypothetical protein NPIRA03_25730 [Nitrospirales bacterium]|nr:MAG: hypothetical protein NPIRA03_25730 [Nitrospirales bacterium]